LKNQRSSVRNLAKGLRRHLTDAEHTLWRKLRDRQLGGVKFRRQHPVGPYITDFCCLERHLIVEVDGGQHAENKNKDRKRTQVLEREGYRVLRFWNHDVLKSTDAVLEKILQEIEIPHPNPLSSRERGKGKSNSSETQDQTNFRPSTHKRISSGESIPLPSRERGKNPSRKGSLENSSSLGFRMPAEWEVHEATWLGWPHNASDWPGKLSTIHWVYAEIVRKLAAGERVRVLVNSKPHEDRAKRFLCRAGINLNQVEFFRIPTNRGWTRDFGPIFLTRDCPSRNKVIARFRFNGWARYPDWKKDNQVPVRLAKRLDCPLLPITFKGQEVVLEGGSIDVNGVGSLLTTEECLLDPQTQVRNPGMSQCDYETVFGQSLGVTNVVWLNKGIAGDDTHGHVDDLCRFVDQKTVVLCQERNVHDENYRPLAENLERLDSASLEDGSKIEVIPLLMPGPLYFDGRRLPASYANFYIGNAAVLVPTFNDPNDRMALGILSELFRDRPVVGIHAVDLVWGFGTIHCLTQQQPALSVS
jgi:agmatine deiminase